MLEYLAKKEEVDMSTIARQIWKALSWFCAWTLGWIRALYMPKDQRVLKALSSQGGALTFEELSGRTHIEHGRLWMTLGKLLRKGRIISFKDETPGTMLYSLVQRKR